MFERTVDDFAFELSLHARQEFFFRLRYTKPVEGVLDLFWNFVPSLALLVGRLQVIKNILKIDVDGTAPLWHRLGLENLKSLEAIVSHPFRLVLHFRNLIDYLGIDPFSRFENGFALSAKIVFVDFAYGFV